MKLKRSEYLQLVGLLALSQSHLMALKDIEEAIRKIVGEEREGGHSMDAIYCNYTADDLLKKVTTSNERSTMGKRQ